MEILIYEGETYRRSNGHWINSQYIMVHEGLQRDLDKAFVKSLDVTKLSTKECINEGDKFKQNGSAFIALKFYEQALLTANCTTMAYLLPRMTSCYRQMGQAQKVIDILSLASKNFGKEMVTPPLLTSAAAAYCDLKDYVRAKKCCDRAYASGGRGNEELSNVYNRIKKETSGRF